jgi:uncharacterized protein YkwD
VIALTASQTAALGVFNAWKASSGHNANMLRTGVSHAGIGWGLQRQLEYKWYWTFVVTN